MAIGKHNNVPDEEFDSEELSEGVRVEMEEHTDDSDIAKGIAKDHLSEFPDYYTRLEEMEKEGNSAKEKAEARLQKAAIETLIPVREDVAEQSALIKNAREGAEYFNKEMEKIFGDTCMYRARVNGNLGWTISVEFANVSKDKANSLMIMNSSAHSKFMMHLNKSYTTLLELGDTVKLEALMLGYQMKQNGIKFRAISAKSPLEVMKKLVKWFKDNKAAIDKLPRKESASTMNILSLREDFQDNLENYVPNLEDVARKGDMVAINEAWNTYVDNKVRDGAIDEKLAKKATHRINKGYLNSLKSMYEEEANVKKETASDYGTELLSALKRITKVPKFIIVPTTVKGKKVFAGVSNLPTLGKSIPKIVEALNAFEAQLGEEGNVWIAYNYLADREGDTRGFKVTAQLVCEQDYKNSVGTIGIEINGRNNAVVITIASAEEK